MHSRWRATPGIARPRHTFAPRQLDPLSDPEPLPSAFTHNTAGKSAPAPAVRTYQVQAETTSVFGRVNCSIRQQHQLTVDGPVQNGCPGEAPTPGEMFLGAAPSCGAEVLQVLARDAGVALTHVSVRVLGTIDRERQPRSNATVFSDVAFSLNLHGPTAEQAADLVAGFQRRCPVYGSLAVASAHVEVHFTSLPVGSSTRTPPETHRLSQP